MTASLFLLTTIHQNCFNTHYLLMLEWEFTRHPYLSVYCAQSLQETGHQGRASRSCSQHTVAGSPHRSSRTGWASSGTPEMASPAARSPCSTGQYLLVIVLRKVHGWIGKQDAPVWEKFEECLWQGCIDLVWTCSPNTELIKKGQTKQNKTKRTKANNYNHK